MLNWTANDVVSEGEVCRSLRAAQKSLRLKEWGDVQHRTACPAGPVTLLTRTYTPPQASMAAAYEAVKAIRSRKLTHFTYQFFNYWTFSIE